LTLEGRSWGGSVTTNIFVKQGTDEDWVSVYHMDNNGVCTNLYYGPLNKWVNPRLERIEFIPLWDGHNPHE
jgi:hypothetical protein